ncbi:hypothetical protein C2E23DRAFT_703320, partial [Lenzites betulinus]
MWLKGYLDLSPTRPKWAFVADALIAKAILASERRVDLRARVNVFLQTWGVNTAVTAGLPRDLARMIKVARKYNVRLDSPLPKEDLIKTLPIWYHFALVHSRSSANCKSSRCLRNNHDVITVADCLSVIRAPTAADTHRNRRDCKCVQCMHDRNVLGCDDPARCAKAASAILGRLRDKWRPGTNANTDGLSLTRAQRDRNLVNATARDVLTFDPSITQGMPIGNAFRVFLQNGEEHGPRACRPIRPFQLECESTVVYTDGSCDENGASDARAGAGIWFGEGDERNAALRVPGGCQTNQAAEAYAVLAAAESTPDFAPLKVVTD